MQDEKIHLIHRMIALLEEIAFNTSSKMVERKEYLERVNASYKPSPTTFYGDVRTQPAARTGEVSKHDAATVSRVQQHANNRPAQKKDPEKFDDGEIARHDMRKP
jgi:hypothetical protein